jgi:hypothetical protein
VQSEIGEAFRSLVNQLRQAEVTRNIQSEQDAYIKRAVDFVKWNQNEDGSWGLGAMLNTGLALQAIGIWTPSDKTWPTRQAGRAGGIDLAFRWLELRQEITGVWENVWNTACIIKAATHLHELDRPCIQRAIKWILEQELSLWGLNQNLPVHHLAQALIAIEQASLDRHAASVAREALLEYVRSRPVESVYTAGQILEAFAVTGVNPASAEVEKLADLTAKRLLAAQVSLSNLLELCAALKGLGAIRGGIDPAEPAIEVTLTKFFHPDRLRDDGSWYRDLTLTSYALIALSEVGQVRKIEGFPTQIYGAVEEAHRQVKAVTGDEIQARRRIAELAALSAVSTCALALMSWVTFVGDVGHFAEENIYYFLAPLLITGIVFLLKQLFAATR